MMEERERSGWRWFVHQYIFRRRDEGSARKEVEDLAALEAALTAEGERRRAGVDMDADRVERVVASLRRRLLECDEARSRSVAGAVRLLRAHLRILCGEESAEQMLSIAAMRTSGGSVEDLTVHHWPEFIVHLGGVLRSLCGISPARAVMEMAYGLRAENQA